MHTIRRFDPARDWPALTELWRRSLPRWPLDPRNFQRVVTGSPYGPDDILVLEAAGRPGGMIATQLYDDGSGNLDGCIRALLDRQASAGDSTARALPTDRGRQRCELMPSVDAILGDEGCTA